LLNYRGRNCFFLLVGFKKCPEFKVGMPYEDEAGYYEREDYDLERKF
jgi:hypothetical protein